MDDLGPEAAEEKFLEKARLGPLVLARGFGNVARFLLGGQSVFGVCHAGSPSSVCLPRARAGGARASHTRNVHAPHEPGQSAGAFQPDARCSSQRRYTAPYSAMAAKVNHWMA